MAQVKGYYTGSDYWGLVNGEFRRFPTENEYLEFVKDSETESEPQ